MLRFYCPQFLASSDHVTAEMPSPKDVSVFHDVRSELRSSESSIIEAVKRKQRAGSYAAWEQSITPLRAAIDDLIERVGPVYGAPSASRHSPSPRPVTMKSSNRWPPIVGKSALSGLGKSDLSGAAQRSRDIDVLMKAPMPKVCAVRRLS